METKKSDTAVVSKAEIAKLEADFLSALRNGVESLRIAGRALVRLMVADPDAGTRLIEEHGIPRNTLFILSRIGRGNLLPELAFKPAMGRLPIEEQKRLVAGPVDAVVIREGKTETIKVDLRNAHPAMLEQVVAPDHIRSLPEQVQYIETRRGATPPAAAATDGVPWRVRGGKIDILRPVSGLSRSDLLTMQRALEG
jgi:hypothetical protein